MGRGWLKATRQSCPVFTPSSTQQMQQEATLDTCLKALDQVLLARLDNFIVFTGYVMLLAKPL